MSENLIPQVHLCDHLFLLVGANPLPNFVAAKLLLKPGGQVYLVHSGKSEIDPSALGTSGIADKLCLLLQNSSHNIRVARKITVQEADGYDIEQKIIVIARDLKGDLGLHYTGGTKAMAVHAYRALDCLGRPVVMSYLDPRSLALKIESRAEKKLRTIGVGLAVRPKIRELTELHGEILKPDLPSQAEVLPAVATVLAQACTDPKGAEKWRDWCSRDLRSHCWHGADWLPEEELASLTLPWPTSPRLAIPVAALRTACQAPAGPTFNLGQAVHQAGFAEIKGFLRWLDGLWLEHYVLGCVRQVAAMSGIHDYGMTIDTDPGMAEHDFEMDVAAMRGYQLFAISCTTSTQKERSKNKLIEAMLRARQLGGDEACFGLVSFYPDAPAFAAQVARRWQADNRVKVWGPDCLAKFPEHLSYWFVSAQPRKEDG